MSCQLNAPSETSLGYRVGNINCNFSMNQIIHAWIFFLVLTGCNDGSSILNDTFSLDSISEGDTIQLKVSFSDCGEWGGHIEHIRIYKSLKYGRTISYTRDTVNCPNPEKFNRRIIESWERKLSKSDQKAFLSFINSLKNMAMEERHSAQYGTNYQLRRTNDETLLEYFDITEKWQAYNEFRYSISAR